jgi:hypothetical protein
MPFKSEKQRKYLWAKEPEIAKKWTQEHGSKIVKNKGGVVNPKGIGLRSRWIKEEK